MNRSILIVEDDANAREGYREFLTAEGFEVTAVSDGLEALTLVIANPPTVVVTDISLPGLNGFDLAETLHKERHTRHIPVLGLTGHWSVDVSSRAAVAGMAAVLLKPCVPAHLLAEIRRVLASTHV